MISSFIQTVLSVTESHRIMLLLPEVSDEAARGLTHCCDHHRSGIAPCPEDPYEAVFYNKKYTMRRGDLSTGVFTIMLAL